MDYEVKLIDIDQPGMDAAITNLVNLSFREVNPKTHRDFSWHTIKSGTYHNNSVVGSPSSFYVGAFSGNELIGFTAFKSHDFIRNGEVVNCFHNCIAVTSEQHKGKRIFPNILSFGKSILLKENVGFLYGIPNHNSRPVIEKIGYKYHGPFLKVNVFNLPGLFESAFSKWGEKDYLYNENIYFQNDFQLIDVKTNEYGKALVVFEDLGNIIWGKIENKIVKGITVRYLSVGGMIVNKPHFFKDSCKKLFKKHNIQFIQFIFHSTSMFKTLFKNPKPAPFVEPFMVLDLKTEITEHDQFNFMPAIKNNF
ncbi:hypothetical protein [Hymenobacter guriensis]|uniref:GNAT family N-acetyltransferase n=1 Tax=Hymenobacter guriensis TaxID=2793065 RepID=A0ABS0L5Z9_9BACT|nr:hypothetical protein [Hymenobacter guriensis]MBG8555501.1 hypothetical protein [Hymenobacter guriensis]